MKLWSDIEQSKKLVEILPLESADMYYSNDNTIYAKVIKECDITCAKVLYGSYDIRSFDVCGNTPCWSLSALLDVLPDGTDVTKDKSDTENEKYMCTVGVKNDIISTFADNPVDVCVEMIAKLKEKGLIDGNVKRLS